MVRRFLTLSLTIFAALGLLMGPAAAQQTGGILKFFHRDSPARADGSPGPARERQLHPSKPTVCYFKPIFSSVPEGDVVGDIDIRLGQIKHPAPVSIVGAPSPQPSLPPSNIVGLSSHVRDVASRIDILFY
jgi:hypothetical protein